MNPYSLHKTPSDVLALTKIHHKALRRKLGLTQAVLADKSGVSLGSIKRFERTGQISFENLLSLAHILGRIADFEQLFQISNELEEAERLFSDKTRRL